MLLADQVSSILTSANVKTTYCSKEHLTSCKHGRISEDRVVVQKYESKGQSWREQQINNDMSRFVVN